MERCEELESSTMIELFILSYIAGPGSLMQFIQALDLHMYSYRTLYTVIAGPSFHSIYQVRVLVMYRDFS